MRHNRKYHFKLATLPHEVRDYFDLRESIFCQEQKLFGHSDIDQVDQIAHPIVAVHSASTNIVGVVRIYESEPRIWYSGRLGVHSDYRRTGRISKGLIEKAVTTATAWGCDRFLATVQLQNVRFFRRLHWNSLQEITIRRRLHHLMEADLRHYPPSQEPQPRSSDQIQKLSYAVYYDYKAIEAV